MATRKIDTAPKRTVTEKDVERIAKQIARKTPEQLSARGFGKLNGIEPLTDDRAEMIKRLTLQALERYNRPRPETDEECQQRISEYVAECARLGDLPTVEGLTSACGCCRETLNSWEHGELGQKRADIIRKAKHLISEIDAALVSAGKIPAVPYIFRSKNYYGMRDQQEMIVTPNTGTETQDAETLARKYLTDEE